MQSTVGVDLLPCPGRFATWLSGNEPACQCRRLGFHPWVGTTPEEGNDNPVQYSCLGNAMDRGA